MEQAFVFIFVPSLVVCALFQTISAQYQWRCSDYDRSENKYYLPDFGEPLTNLQASTGVVINTGKTYVYPAEISCALGTVTDIQFCYFTRNNTINSSVSVFTLLTLIQNGDFFTVTNIIPVSSTPTSDKCSDKNDTLQCCDVMALGLDDMFEVPSDNFSIGIRPPDRITAALVAFEASNSMYIAPCYVTPKSRLEGNTYNLTGLLGNEPVLYLQLYINATDIPTTGATESNKAGAYGLGPILGGTLGGTISIFVVVILVVLLALIPIRRHQTRMKQHRPNERAIDNAVYCITEGTAVKSALESSREYAEVSPFSDDVLSNRFPENNDIEQCRGAAVSGLDAPVRYGPVSSANPIFLHDDLQNEKHHEYDDIYMEPAKNVDELYVQLHETQLDTVTRESVHLSDKIGAGQFGDVFQGIWKCTECSVEVAVKTFKEGSNEEDKVKFLQEAAIMGQFKHPNVVTMYGLVTDGEPILLVLEMLARGDLRKYLLSMKTDDGVSDEIDGHELLSYCRQIASGMAYLSSKSFVHRDLAARNILVSDDRICKIADFGMSRDLADENYYVSHGGIIPVKWTAPEALNYMKYSTASDVWSFGMVMYEIWSVGHKPFEGVKNIRVIEMVNSGYRPPPPPGCPRVIYSIMMSCWHFKAESRPDFTAIASQLSVSNSKLLHWSGEDRTNYPKATDIGASLKHGEKLYKDLQLKYKFQNSLSQDIP